MTFHLTINNEEELCNSYEHAMSRYLLLLNTGRGHLTLSQRTGTKHVTLREAWLP